MFGFVVIEVMTLSGNPLIINKIKGTDEKNNQKDDMIDMKMFCRLPNLSYQDHR